jgi:excisionase family DNA binding protein
MSAGMRERPLTLIEAADYLNVSPRYMRRIVAEHRIAYFKVGRILRFSPIELDRYLSASLVSPAKATQRKK